MTIDFRFFNNRCKTCARGALAIDSACVIDSKGAIGSKGRMVYHFNAIGSGKGIDRALVIDQVENIHCFFFQRRGELFAPC